MNAYKHDVVCNVADCGGGLVFAAIIIMAFLAGARSNEATPPVASQAPASTSTPDPVIEAIIAAVRQDRFTTVTLKLVYSSSNSTVTTADQFSKLVDTALAACVDSRTRTPADTASVKTLWPGPYATLHSEVSSACFLITALPDAKYERGAWRGYGHVSEPGIDAAIRGLPDYSDNQLRRAIAERK